MIARNRRAPKTSTQRSREFRERNPHYHQQYRLKKKAYWAEYFAAQAEVKALPLLAPLFISSNQATPLALPAPADVTNAPITVQLSLFASPEATPEVVPKANPQIIPKTRRVG